MFKNRGSITLTALMAMLIFSLYGVAFYGRSVSMLKLQEMQIELLQETYSGDLSRAYEIADNLNK